MPPACIRPLLRLLMLFWLSRVRVLFASSVLPVLVIVPPASWTLFPEMTLPLLTVISFGDR
ncbi:hypothetical protein D3C73_1316060 [compost metagenome]